MVNKMPIVGISGSVMIDQGGMFPGYHRSYVNEDYVTITWERNVHIKRKSKNKLESLSPIS